MVRRAIVSLILILNCIALTSCFDYDEVENILIVAGVAVDKGQGNNYIFTLDIVDFSGEQKEQKTKTKLMTTEGKSFDEAAQFAENKTSKNLVGNNLQIIILSEEVAKEGIQKVLDYAFRNTNFRQTIEVLISKEKTAGEILELKTISESIHSFSIDKQLENNEKYLSNVPYVLFYEVIDKLQGKGQSLILPCIKKQKNIEEISEVVDTAVFKKGNLLGFLDKDPSFYTQMILNKVKKGIIVIDELGVSFNIYSNKTEIEPSYKNGTFSVTIKTDTNFELAEQSTEVDYSKDEKLKELEELLCERIKKNILATVLQVKNEFKTDIFGFGVGFSKKYPRVWQDIGSNWDDYFMNVEVNVNSKATIQDSRTVYKPIQVS